MTQETVIRRVTQRAVIDCVVERVFRAVQPLSCICRAERDRPMEPRSAGNAIRKVLKEGCESKVWESLENEKSEGRYGSQTVPAQ